MQDLSAQVQDLSDQVQDLSAQDLSAQVQDLLAHDLSAQDLSAQDLSAQDLSAQDLAPQDLSAQDLSPTQGNKNILIKITIFLIIIEVILLFFFNNIKDRIILYFALYGQFLLLFSLRYKKPFLTEISHVFFGSSILMVLFLSNNKFLNIFCYMVLLITFISRYMYNGCLLGNCLENNISFLPECLNYHIIHSIIFASFVVKTMYFYNNSI